MASKIVSLMLLLGISLGDVPVNKDLKACGEAWYLPSQYSCYNDNFLCPVLSGTPTLRCSQDCYLPDEYSCDDGNLVQKGTVLGSGNASSTPSGTSPESSSPVTSTPSSAASCTALATTLHLSSPPYENYLYSDCHVSSHVIVTSPLSDSNLTIVGPRLLVAWPAGNSGAVSFFAPVSGVNGSLSIELTNSSIGNPVGPVYKDEEGGNATVGVEAQVSLNSSAILSVAVLGSIRTIRDFVEGPSLLYPKIQNATKFETTNSGGLTISRLWLDNITTTTLTFTPADSNKQISIDNQTAKFEAGTYTFSASFDYPQLTQFTAKEVLNPDSQILIKQQPSQTESLSFLSYTTKLTAGAWRFLTYFGRDSMISALLMEPILSQGQDGAMEAVLAGVLERINRTDGSVCHEETIGDYATWLNYQNNITSTAPQCDYKMIDSDYYLPILLDRYLTQSPGGVARSEAFLSTQASVFPENSNLTYANLSLINAEKIMTTSAAFAGTNNQTIDNLIHLKQGQIVGEWRDSTYGIGGGRIPFDVNTALVPAALRSISVLARAGYFPTHSDWGELADQYAEIWEDFTLQFFEVTVPISDAITRLSTYVSASSFSGPDEHESLDGDVVFHAVALEGNNNLSKVEVMNTDDCFRHFLLNTTNQTQLTRFVNSTANNIRRPFPAGLMTNVSMLVANPAYGNDSVYAANWTTSAYHGTVVWSWQLSMMARGLELQLSRCSSSTPSSTPNSSENAPDFCTDETVYSNVKTAYNVLWDSIEANKAHLSTEVWSWTYNDGEFKYIDLGALPPPPGQNPTESDIVQLWSLTFLAVVRNEAFK